MALRFSALVFGATWAVALGIASAQGVAEAPPYALIANALPDTTDQLLRDSLNMKISPIRVNQAGYLPGDVQYFYYVGNATTFTVLDAASGATRGSGTLKSKGFNTSGAITVRATNHALGTGNERYKMTSPTVSGAVMEGQLPAGLPTGTYIIQVGSERSQPFVVNGQVYTWVRDALLKFFGINRSGASESWFHPDSHLRDAVPGGWYDCGDHLKESQTQGYALMVLSLTAAALPERDVNHYAFNQAHSVNTDGIPDILAEAKHGADYVLRSYDLAGGKVANMSTSVGDFGKDHSWWGPPERQDAMPTAAGGPERQLRNEVGGNVTGLFAAGLAFTAGKWKDYDPTYSAKALKAARDLYAYGKLNPKGVSSNAYSGGDGVTSDDLSLAAIALAWATGEKTYIDDVFRNSAIAHRTDQAGLKGTFTDGWFVKENPTPLHGRANTSWATTHVYGLWAFYKLILRDPIKSAQVGLSETERLQLIRDVAYAVVRNISQLDGGGTTTRLAIPDAQPYATSGILYDPNWNIIPFSEQDWIYNRYISGNLTELFIYYDIAKDVQSMTNLPGETGNENWNAAESKKLLIRSFDYMLGINPWDLSMVFGIGDKTPNHPHHRAANPEGKNFPGAFANYRYRPPVGALFGGAKPSTVTLAENWENHFVSEVCLDGTAALLLPAVGLSGMDTLIAPEVTVKILSVDLDKAIIEVSQSRYGTATLRYGTTTSLGQTTPASELGSVHRITLTGLTAGTTYYFEAVASNVTGQSTVNDNAGQKWSFTTLKITKATALIAQVKVCRVTADSAEILWFTPNGEYGSKVTYGIGKPPTQIQDGDVTGTPTRFHRVTLGGLKERTQYWFYVESDKSRDDNLGQYYTFTTPVKHVEFEIRALQYVLAPDIHFLGLDIINNDIQSYDSLDIRVYLRGTDAEMLDMGARIDVGITYTEVGYQGPHFKGAIDSLLQKQKPVKIPDTYDSLTGISMWYFSIPLGPVVMKSGSRFRMDIGFVKRNLPFNNDLLNAGSTHIPGGLDWSWRPHSVAQGDPIDYAGVPVGEKTDVDNNYWNLQKNPYITVYRKGQFVYGYSPSQKEQATKVNTYQMTSLVTSPLLNNPETRVQLDQPASLTHVKGWASITEDGILTDIWVNGERVADISQVATYDKIQKKYALDIPVKLHAGGEEIDITLFGGKAIQCDGCVGCTFSNHHFFIDFRKSDAFPSKLALVTPAGAALPSQVAVGVATPFLVRVEDKSGDRSALVDTLEVVASNRNQGDTLTLLLVETGPKTGIFQTLQPTTALDVAANVKTKSQIALAEGDSIWVIYRDPTDPDDSSSAFLFTPANFPIVTAGAIFDVNGDGAAETLVIHYSKTLTTSPDSVAFGFPGATGNRSVTAGTQMTVLGDRLTISLTVPFPFGITAFTPGETPVLRSWLLAAGKTRLSSVPLVDSVGPVLTGAVLHPSTATDQGDTLVVRLSESIASPNNATTPFARKSVGASATPNSLQITSTLNHLEPTWSFLIPVSPTSPLAPGDSLRLNTMVTDIGGIHAHANNPWIEITGAARLPPKPPKPPLRFEAIFMGGVFNAENGISEKDPFTLAQNLGEITSTQPTIRILANSPFHYETRIFTNLGEPVASWVGELTPAQWMATQARVESNAPPIAWDLQWNSLANDRTRAGTGAYIWMLRAQSSEQPDKVIQIRVRFGLIRSN